MIDLPSAILLAAWDGPAIVGTVGAMLFPAYFNRAVTIGQETFYWAAPSHRGMLGPAMLDAVEQAAREAGASQFIMVSLDALRPEAVGRLYERRGYSPLEHSYVRSL
jgi:GNAT superfamily N-acetyltransferase